MKKLISILIFNLYIIQLTTAQDANNPIDPNPTVGLFNRAYGNDKSKTQIIANATFKKWFVRFSAETQFNYKADNEFKGGNFLVARLFESKNGQNKYGVRGSLAIKPKRLPGECM